MLRGSVTVGSVVGYDRHFKKCKTYLGTVSVERRPQLFLQDVVSEIDKVKWIVLFIAYLGEQGVRG